jgi:cytohesin
MREDIFLEHNPNFAERRNKAPYDYPGIFKVLVDAKADISALVTIASTKLTPLHLALFVDNIEAVNALLAAGADPNFVNHEGMSPLFMACDKADDCLGAVPALIAAGADVNHVDNSGRTALMSAVTNKIAIMVSALIAAGADVNVVLPNPNCIYTDQTSLDIALDKGHDVIVAILKEAGAYTWSELVLMTNRLFCVYSPGQFDFYTEMIGCASKADQESALIYGVYKNNLEIVRSLLSAGVGPSLSNEKDLLCIASIGGFTDIVRVLVDAGAEMMFDDCSAIPALQLAAQYGHRDVVALLLIKAKELKNTNK